ncbi:hydrolase [Halobacillus salinus]|uniref:hydrolase n=1 Tax=Halobacillus salinus TaxID=192814 RepID=UPI0015928C9D|nr:hydrolase [Halobacillus salinus]
MMHLLIAHRVTEQCWIEDKTAFLLGSLAPDAAFDKELSHFYIGKVEDYSRQVDVQAFTRKYEAYQDKDYIKGYYTHLIADQLWLKGFYLSWLKNRMNHDDNLYQRYHSDFRNLNGKLIEHFGARETLLSKVQKLHGVLPLDEVEPNRLERFLVEMREDFQYDSQSLSDTLRVFTFDQIIGYVETAAHQSVMALESMQAPRSKQGHNPTLHTYND